MKEEDILASERERAERERAERDRVERDRAERERAERDRVERDRAERERAERELKQREILQNSYLTGLGGLHPHAAPPGLPPPLGLGLLDRSRLVPPGPLPPNPYSLGLDPRLPGPSLWSPFDKASELTHRLELERAAVEQRERMAMLSRLSGPTAILEQERRLLQEHQDMELRRQFLERLPPYERERLALEKMRSESLAAALNPGLNPFSRTISPMFNHLGLKNGSPAGIPGIPPPLIPSASATLTPSIPGPSRSHDNSPSSSKTRGFSAADSTSDLKEKRDALSNDPDTPHIVR